MQGEFPHASFFAQVVEETSPIPDFFSGATNMMQGFGEHLLYSLYFSLYYVMFELFHFIFFVSLKHTCLFTFNTLVNTIFIIAISMFSHVYQQ
jgi:hypothetical protein